MASTGTLKATSLRKVKEAVLEVRRGEECGLGLDGFNDFPRGGERDVVECYSVKHKKTGVCGVDKSLDRMGGGEVMVVTSTHATNE